MKYLINVKIMKDRQGKTQQRTLRRHENLMQCYVLYRILEQEKRTMKWKGL